MRGFFITFEGIDGAGKTTQQHLAAQALREQGYDVLESREPGGTQLAEKVRALVLDPELPLTTVTQTLLYLAARSEHVDKLLRPALEAGKIIICDRFSDSTLVYQGLAQGKAPEEIAQLRRLGSFATGGLEPDLTLV
ncbi:dTMP kinase, partial [Phascolarctobacterium succinatutens]